MTVRVHKLAKELGLTSKELVEKLHALKVDVKGSMSSLDDDTAVLVKEKLAPKKKKKTAPKAAAKAATKPKATKPAKAKPSPKKAEAKKTELKPKKKETIPPAPAAAKEEVIEAVVEKEPEKALKGIKDRPAYYSKRPCS